MITIASGVSFLATQGSECKVSFIAAVKISHPHLSRTAASVFALYLIMSR